MGIKLTKKMRERENMKLRGENKEGVGKIVEKEIGVISSKDICVYEY